MNNNYSDSTAVVPPGFKRGALVACTLSVNVRKFATLIDAPNVCVETTFDDIANAVFALHQGFGTYRVMKFFFLNTRAIATSNS